MAANMTPTALLTLYSKGTIIIKKITVSLLESHRPTARRTYPNTTTGKCPINGRVGRWLSTQSPFPGTEEDSMLEMAVR